MVRRRVEMKKIENTSSRQVTFSKRRKGLLKKAQDLSVLCDADVAVIVFSNRGRLYDFCTAPSFAGLLERYEHCVEAQNTKSVCEAEIENTRVASIQKCLELQQMLNRALEEQQVDKMSMAELIELEKQLHDARRETISRKTKLQLQAMEVLGEKEKMLLEEKKLLQKEIAGIRNKEGGGEGETSIQEGKGCCGLDGPSLQIQENLFTLNLFR